MKIRTSVKVLYYKTSIVKNFTSDKKEKKLYKVLIEKLFSALSFWQIKETSVLKFFFLKKNL